MDVARVGVRVPLSESRVKDIVLATCRRERVGEALISVTFVTKARIARMNREFLNHRGATDVITFELRNDPTSSSRAVVGDIYIAPDVGRDNARAQGVGVREEIARLVVHGTLHVLGYSHPEDDTRTTGRMWRRQEAIVASIV